MTEDSETGRVQRLRHFLRLYPGFSVAASFAILLALGPWVYLYGQDRLGGGLRWVVVTTRDMPCAAALEEADTDLRLERVVDRHAVVGRRGDVVGRRLSIPLRAGAIVTPEALAAGSPNCAGAASEALGHVPIDPNDAPEPDEQAPRSSDVTP